MYKLSSQLTTDIIRLPTGEYMLKEIIDALKSKWGVSGKDGDAVFSFHSDIRKTDEWKLNEGDSPRDINNEYRDLQALNSIPSLDGRVKRWLSTWLESKWKPLEKPQTKRHAPIRRKRIEKEELLPDHVEMREQSKKWEARENSLIDNIDYKANQNWFKGDDGDDEDNNSAVASLLVDVGILEVVYSSAEREERRFKRAFDYSMILKK